MSFFHHQFRPWRGLRLLAPLDLLLALLAESPSPYDGVAADYEAARRRTGRR